MLNCQKCGHHWEPVVSNPLKCPACNQPKYWNKKVRNVDGDGGVDGNDSVAAAGREGKRASVPVLRKSKGGKVNVHPVQPLRDELVVGSGHLQPPSHEGHSVYRAGSRHYCSDCKVSF